MAGVLRPEDILENFSLYFDWSNKTLRELGLVHLLSDAMAKCGEDPFWSIAPAKRDPPDCTALSGAGTPVAIEVTEFVCQETIRSYQRGGLYYRSWTEQEVIRRLEAIILRKDAKVYRGGPYREVVLLVYTAEPNVTFLHFHRCIARHRFPRVRQIDTVYLLFPFDLRLRYCPFLRLSLASPGLPQMRLALPAPQEAYPSI